MRRSRERSRSEGGFSVIEVTIASMVLLAALAIFIGSLVSGMRASDYSQRRNQALDDLRTAAAAFSKDARQAVRVRSMDANGTWVTIDTYVSGTPTTVTWQVTGTNLQRVVGTTTRTFVLNLTAPQVFSYHGVVDPSQVTRIRLAVGTQPDPTRPALMIESDVEMRNVG